MGFYFDLAPTNGPYYQEQEVPALFWALFTILGFALTCMGIAAFGILSDLVRSGEWIDKALIGAYGVSWVGYLFIGIRLIFFRKFVDWGKGRLTWGYRAFGFTFTLNSLHPHAIDEAEILHSSQTTNIAPSLHGDRRYFIQGHYRLVVKANGRSCTLDRSTDPDALEALRGDLSRWLMLQKSS